MFNRCVSRCFSLLVLTVLAVSIPSAALACRGAAPTQPAGECTMKKTANISISFNSIETDIEAIESYFSDKRKLILELSEQADTSRLLLSSMSYNINPQTGNRYNVSGSLSVQVMPAEQATSLLKLLSKNGFNARLSMSAYPKNGKCDFSSVESRLSPN